MAVGSLEGSWGAKLPEKECIKSDWTREINWDRMSVVNDQVEYMIIKGSEQEWEKKQKKFGVCWWKRDRR